MPPPDVELARLQDMLSAAEAVVRFTRAKSLDDYRADEVLRSAVERQIEIIGEGWS